MLLAWPVDLALTVASHGWAYLAPWQWDPENSVLALPSGSADAVGSRSR